LRNAPLRESRAEFVAIIRVPVAIAKATIWVPGAVLLYASPVAVLVVAVAKLTETHFLFNDLVELTRSRNRLEHSSFIICCVSKVGRNRAWSQV